MLSVLTFRTPKEAVEKANNTPYGLSAGVWTDKGSRILWMASQLRAGVVWSNTFNKFDPASPFGGYKESGYGREGGRHGLEGYLRMSRIDVRKTYKLYIGGAFPRSESGRSYVVDDAKGKFWANASHASRKDARDAVVAARSAFGGWSGRTAYNRGQVVYRIAEVLEDRREQFESELRTAEGITAAKARTYVDAAVDRLVWYAGWADKIAQVVGGANPVAGPYFNHSAPEPTGVVAVVAPAGPAARPGQRRRAGDHDRQHRGRGRQRGAPADRDHPRRGDGDLRRAGRRGQRAHRPAGRARARGWPRTWTSTAST